MRSYQLLVSSFRQVTDFAWEESGRCCLRTVRGVPECCAWLPVDQDLTFTARETELLRGWWQRDPGMLVRDDGMWVLDRSVWTRRIMEPALHMGVLANTLECASHPLRPVVRMGTVTDVVAVDGCNTELGLEFWRQNKGGLIWLWQRAVDLVGVKSYYCTESIRPDMVRI